MSLVHALMGTGGDAFHSITMSYNKACNYGRGRQFTVDKLGSVYTAVRCSVGILVGLWKKIVLIAALFYLTK